MKIILVLMTILSSSLVFAADKTDRKPSSSDFEIADCEKSGAPTSILNYVEHKDFAKGAVRLFVMDTDGEPVCCSMFANLIVHDSSSEIGGYKCLNIRAPTSTGGVSSLNMSKVSSSYNSKLGLTLEIPFGFYTDGVSSTVKSVKLLVNQKKGTVKIIR